MEFVGLSVGRLPFYDLVVHILYIIEGKDYSHNKSLELISILNTSLQILVLSDSSYNCYVLLYLIASVNFTNAFREVCKLMCVCKLNSVSFSVSNLSERFHFSQDLPQQMQFCTSSIILSYNVYNLLLKSIVFTS
jgi:hypothetical protein